MKKFKFMSLPYFIWLCVLVFIPVIIMLVLAFTKTDGLDFSSAKFTLKNFEELGNPIYIRSLFNSLKIAFLTTVVCVLVGYPAAYIISFSKIKRKMLVLLCMILPMWSNMLLRIVAWEKLFYEVSILNKIGISFNLIGSEGAVIFVNAITYLPFMIFPIFTILEKTDRSLIEASKDLGVPAYKTFFKVTLPLSLKGVFSGIIMVFLPAATGFAISERIGAGQILLIGNVIENMFKRAFNYNLGALLAIFVSVIITISVILLQKIDKEGETLL